MIALDTNVLARFYLNDEPEQAKVAARLLTEEDIFIPKTVLLELEWVMRGVAHIAPAGIARSISHLLSLENVHVEDETVVRAALSAYEKGIDFADALHAAASSDTDGFVTFDSRLVKRAPRAIGRPLVRIAQ